MQTAFPPDPPAETIVVTARALPDAAAERAYSVEILDPAALRNAPSSQLDQVLKLVPGLHLFRRSDARSAHPTSQGVTLRALGGSASGRALLVLDGVPQADPFGGWVNWPAYDPASLAEVRVVRGGGSMAHGPGALAGAIEMTSRLAPGFGAGVEAGSRESLEGRLLAGAAIAGGTLGLSLRGVRGDGFVPVTEETRGAADRRAPYRTASARGLWAAPLSASTDIQLSALGFTDQRERGLAFTQNRTRGIDASLRLVGSGRWQWSALGYGQWRELASSFASVSADRASATRVSLQDSVPSNALGASFELRPPVGANLEFRVGGDVRRARGESRELFSYLAGEPTRRRIAGGATLTSGLFAEAATIVGGVTLSGGARLDHWRISDGELRERVIATGLSQREERYGARSGWLPTARAGAVLNAGGGLDLRSAGYLGWRMPTLNELFRPFRAGADATAANPALKPERLAGGEVGGRYQRNGISFSVTAFVNRLKDTVANVTLGNGPGVFPGVGFVAAGGEYRQRQNLDAIRVRGLELAGALRRGPWWASAGLSLTDARVRGSGAAASLDGLRPAQTPEWSAAASLGWESGGRALSLALHHVGDQPEDDRNLQSLPAATTVDAFAAWRIARQLQLVARAENLLDELVVAGISGNRVTERATPRTLWLGLRFTRESAGRRSSGD